jgi:hypothetical protein
MNILAQALGGIALSLVVTSAGADIMFSPTPSGTGNNVVFNQQPPDQTGTTIFGNINSVDTLVQFTSTQVLTTPLAGTSSDRVRTSQHLEQPNYHHSRL